MQSCLAGFNYGGIILRIILAEKVEKINKKYPVYTGLAEDIFRGLYFDGGLHKLTADHKIRPDCLRIIQENLDKLIDDILKEAVLIEEESIVGKIEDIYMEGINMNDRGPFDINQEDHKKCRDWAKEIIKLLQGEK